MAKTSPGEFASQVRTEASKVVWPSAKETWVTAVMVFLLTSMLAVFFFGVDAFFAMLVKSLLGLLV